MWFLWVMVLGCAGERGEKPPPGDTDTRQLTDTASSSLPTTDTGTTGPITTDPLDAASIAALEAALEQFAIEAAGMSIGPVETAITHIEQTYEPPCPRVGEVSQGTGWQGDCVTDQGYRIWGNFVVIENGWDDWVDEVLGEEIADVWGAVAEPGWERLGAPTVSTVGYDAVCNAERGDTLYRFGGEYLDTSAVWGALTVRRLRLDGIVVDPDQDGTGSWVARGVEPNLIRTELDGTSGGRVRLYQGGFGVLGAAWPTVWAEGVVLGNAATGDVCEREPDGVLSVRDPLGYWYDVTYDGDAGGTCDGCGRVFRGSDPVGTACPDLTPLLQETAP